MTLFPKINAIYSTQFGSSPPTRACVAVLMPTDQNIRLKICGVANIGKGSRKSLHVQSLSYWAAANIGPYSQGVTVRQISPSYIASESNIPLPAKIGRRTIIHRRTNRSDPYFSHSTHSVRLLSRSRTQLAACSEGRSSCKRGTLERLV